MWSILTKILNREKDPDKVKIYVRLNGIYVKGRDLARSPAWRAKVKELIDADLTGRGDDIIRIFRLCDY